MKVGDEVRVMGPFAKLYEGMWIVEDASDHRWVKLKQERTSIVAPSYLIRLWLVEDGDDDDRDVEGWAARCT